MGCALRSAEETNMSGTMEARERSTAPDHIELGVPDMAIAIQSYESPASLRK